MSDQQPYSESDLDSPEYRERLLRKLNYLITVLELAIGKVHRSLAGPEPDVERLLKIRKNLQDTLHVCVRARSALENRDTLPASLSSELEKSVNLSREIASVSDGSARERGTGSASKRGVRAEMSSEAELRRFKELGRIDPREVQACDLDELSRRLLGS